MSTEYSLGIDVSTQSVSVVVLDYIEKRVVMEHSIVYTEDARLAHYVLDAQTKSIPITIEGLIEQPPLLFL